MWLHVILLQVLQNAKGFFPLSSRYQGNNPKGMDVEKYASSSAPSSSSV
jgi:hypothetical protein